MEINDLVELLDMSEQVEAFTKDRLSKNPKLVDRAAVVFMDYSELTKQMDSAAKILVSN